MRIVLVVIAIWFVAAFLLGPLIGRVLKYGHIRPTTGPPPPEPPEPNPDPPPDPDSDAGP
ncbi:hypothetical protein ACEZCY_36410 [Streptacidiphilus sp. N1-12]|uniref:Uncharacterized protein n=2 Tax=Streptacidiphilus alkalitolerans TaxID=3342712 RepID=A0ABV6VLP2_9ACTN